MHGGGDGRVGMSGTSSGGIGEQAAARPLGLAYRKAQGILSAPIGLREATARTKTASQALHTTVSTPLLGEDGDERHEDIFVPQRRELRTKPKPKPKPKPTAAPGDGSLGVEEQIRLMEAAATSQAGRTSKLGDGDGGSGGDGDATQKSPEDLAYAAFLAEHPEWYVVLPEDASLLDKICTLPRSSWLFCVRLGENFGYGYVAAVFFTYGLNQGISGAWYGFGTKLRTRLRHKRRESLFV